MQLRISSQKLTGALCALVLAIGLAFAFSAAAPQDAFASTNSKAHAAYKRLLPKCVEKYDAVSQGSLPYAVVDLDGNGVDELIIEPGWGYCTQVVYTYTNGRVVKAREFGHCWFDLRYWRATDVVYAESGHQGVITKAYFKMTSTGKLKAVAWSVNTEYLKSNGELGWKHQYYVKGKKVSKTTCASYVKKLKKGTVRKAYRNRIYSW